MKVNHRKVLHVSAMKRRWPFRIVTTIVFLFFIGILLVLVIAEWYLLTQSNHAVPVVVTTTTTTTAAIKNGKVDTFDWKQKQDYPPSNPQSKNNNNDNVKIQDHPLSPQPRTIVTRTNNDSFQNDALCGGCRGLRMTDLMRSRYSPERCGSLIYRVAKRDSSQTKQQQQQQRDKLQNKRLQLEGAAKIVNQNFTDCRACLDCEAKHKHYWRYDRAGPAIVNAKTHYFRSIPEEHRRIPRSVLMMKNNDNPNNGAAAAAASNQNLTEYFKSLNQKHDKPKQYLFEYNPSIVHLPSHLSFPDSILQDTTPVYLASFRVATTQGCWSSPDTTLHMIGGDWEGDQIPEKKDYLGLALLRQDLSVIEETVVDLPLPFKKREDFRLFVLHDQLFVATYCKLTPMWVYHKDDEQQYSKPVFPGAAVPTWKAKNVFPSPLRVRIGSDVTQCSNEATDNQYAKNLNFFVNQMGDTMVEFSPLGPHVVRPLYHVLNQTETPPGHEDDISTNEFPVPSFFTVEELVLANEFNYFEPPFTQDRGGACCIEIMDPRQPTKKLWIGVSHSKTPHARKKLAGKLKQNQYVSRWYAFEQEHPYKTVAVSGFFCLSSLPGDAKANADALKLNPLMQHAVSKYPWTLGTLTMDCPVIHFITGMTEKVGDASKIIVAYGVADCTSWFVEIDKLNVIHLLFDGPGQNG